MLSTASPVVAGHHNRGVPPHLSNPGPGEPYASVITAACKARTHLPGRGQVKWHEA